MLGIAEINEIEMQKNSKINIDIVLHGQRVSMLSFYISKYLGLCEDECLDASNGGLLHDYGKIGIRQALLYKPEKLTPSEYEEIKRHARLSYDIVRTFKYYKKYSHIVLYHHERIDGSGYHGLKGENIPILSQIIGLADAYDALRSDRVYRKAYTLEDTLKILEDEKKQFDSRVYESFLRAIEKNEIINGLYRMSSIITVNHLTTSLADKAIIV